MGVENITATWVSGDLYFHRVDTMATICCITDDHGSNINLGLGVQGIAAGYKIARGNASLTGDATIVTGLTAVVDFSLAIRNEAGNATSANYCTVANGFPSSGSLLVYRWMPTSASTTTLIASTTKGTLDWIVVGT